MNLEKLLKQIPEATSVEVERAKERYNNRVRGILRQETGLHFKRGENDEVTQIRISVVPGLPESLKQKHLPVGSELAVMLAPLRGNLKELNIASEQTLKELVSLLREEPGVPQLLKELKIGLEPVAHVVKQLLEETQRFDLADWMLELNEDVLGVYRYSAKTSPRKNRSGDGSIELYWGVIGLVSRLIGCEVEALTLVVLAHELSHAYTHLGMDIDGERWKNEDFNEAETGLREGLAQYYTSRVCSEFSCVYPAAHKAYEALLKNQPADYKTHCPWLELHTPEEVRLSMLETRRQSRLKLDEFNQLLLSAKTRLRNAKTAQNEDSEIEW